MIIAFDIPGEPVAKGRARSFVRNGRVGHFTPEKTANYESLVRLCGYKAMLGSTPSDRPVVLELVARFAIPKSWSKKRQGAALSGAIAHTKRPDLDNCIKAIKDGLNGVAWVDDSQVVRISASKAYGAMPGVSVSISYVDDQEAA